MTDTDETLESLDLIRRRLLDTSKRNRLLNFKESKSRTILIADEDADAIFSALVHGGATPELMPLPEATLFDLPDGEHAAGATIVAAPDATTDKNRRLQTPYTAQKLEKLGSRICREARSAIEETGSNMLFLSFGLLEWYEDDNSTLPHLAPLVLVPAQIEKKRLNQETNCYSYAVSYSEEDLETNLSLAEMLRQEFGLILPDFTPELTPELYFCDIERRLLSVKKRWKIRRELLLDLFSFAKLLMYKDLDDQAWPGEAQLSTKKTLVEILAGREDAGGMATFHPEEYRIDNHQRAQELHLVTDADSSQHSAIVDALDRDDNLVIEGPPGTGKSQTITNIIAAALSAGKTVLFVAEKKAALEVVRGRLERANLGDFCLELHSHKTQKGKLHADLRTRIQKTYPDDQSLERAVQEQLSERDKLLRYSQLVTAQPGRDGDRVYEILWAAERWRSACPADLPRPTIKGPLSLSKSEITQRAVLLQDLARLRDELPAAARDRWSCLEPASFLPGDEEAICLALDTFAQRCDALHGALAALRAEGAFEGEVTLELATSLANADLAVLESCPPLSAPAIAQKLAIPNNGTRVREMHAAVERHALLLREARGALGDAAATETSQVMAEKLAELLQMGLGHLSVDDLPELMAGHRRLPEMVSRAEALYKEMEPLLTPPSQSAAALEAARGVLALASDQRLGLDPQPHAPHAHESAPAALARARAEQQTLSKERIELEKEFSLQHLPAKEELLGLSRELRSYASAFAAALSPAYWKLKRRVREFLQPDQTFCRTALPQKLEQAAALLERIHTFDSHPDHSRALGPLYRGMATDFERLEDLVSWSQELARATGSHQRAMALLPRLQELRSMNERLQAPVMECLTQLDRALAACRRQPAREQELAQLCHGCGATGTALNIVSVAATSWGVPGTRTLGELAAGLKAHSLAKELERQVAANRELAQLLETEFAGIDTDTARLVAQTEWFEAVGKRVGCQEQMLAWLTRGGEGGRIERLKEALLQARSFQRGIVDLAEAMARHGSFDMPAFLPSPPQNCTLSQLRDKSLACREYGYLLGKWADFRRLGREADDLGLREFVDLVLKRELTPEHAYALYQFGAYDAMARELLGTDPVLAGYTRTAIEGVIGRFVALDKKIQTAHTRRIAHRLSQRPVPTGQSGARVSSLTELALIKHEIEKQKRHLPLRQLVQRSGRALQSLKPCFMMSPLSVAQYLPPGSLNFDLVIMDEASQLKPEDAMGAVARGSRLIVVGDSRQLPPTSFFDRLDGVDDDDENLVASAESILDRCLQVYPRRRLRWHYRSEHESLIAFSNAMFYDDNPLLVFPSPQRSDLRYGVHSRYIDGASYHKGRNLKEAQAVALAIRDHYRNAPELSLGVATFNREQSELIEELLERLQKEDPLLDRQIRESQESQESFFIKNLENVQGDERDVIFISTTYGPDPSTGRVFQRFGPLAGEDGWRRLNVITTRAKKRLELFTSLRPGDVVPGEGSKRGVHALKAYLEYAASGILPDYGLSTGASPDSDFEIAVMKHLSDRGFQSVPQVGVAGFAIDIGVKHPDNGEDYLLGIECDGASYHSAKSVRDRDRLRQEVLERKGWTIHRIWSTDWFKNRDFELNRLLDRIKTALDADRSSRATRLTPDKAAAEPVKTEQAPALAAPAELSLLEELKVFNEAQIVPAFPDRSRGLLRDEILRYIVNCKPQSLAEFHQAVPIELRQNTDTRQLQYLEEIFSIVAGYC